MAIDKNQFISIFLAETEGYLTALDQGLVRLEQEPENAALVGDLFRAAHTIKGSARMMGFSEVATLAHQMEDVLSILRQGDCAKSPELTATLFQSLDALKAALAKITTDKPKTEERETNPQTPTRAPKAIAVEATKAERPPHDAQFSKAIAVEGEAHSALPDEGATAEGSARGTQAPIIEEYIPVPITRINHLLNLIGEMVVHQVNSSYKAGLLKKFVQQIASMEKMLYELEGMVKEQLAIPDELLQHQGTILRASREMDKAAHLLGRMHSIESILGKFHADMRRLSDDTQSEVFRLNPMVEELQRKMKEIRMLPCSSLFEGFPRLVRDIAHEQGKKIRLEMKGGETELDKKMLESLKGPLIHLLRNAVDHGIESPEARLAAGKPETGKIEISAEQRGGKVFLSIRDDGRGIDLAEVRRTALQKGLASEEELGAMASEAAYRFLFSEGFSTSPIITDVSGRGIGLSVVQTELDRLKAEIHVESCEGQGTCFKIELPLTLAVLQVLLVEAGGLRWGIPMSGLEECVRLPAEQIPSIENRQVLQIQGASVPLASLAGVLGLRPEAAAKSGGASAAEASAVVVNHGGKRVGFLVDRMLGEQEAFKDIGSHLKKVKAVGGATVLANGEVVAILDIPELILQSHSTQALSQSSKAGLRRKLKKKILVVEDSLTTRELEKTILENNGYEVDTAIDGLDALDKLSSNPFDCVVSDIQMPRMDGFELCKSIKGSERLKSLPVIFVTSLSKEEEKRRGIEMGAQAYLVKSQFDQKNLLSTLERLL